ncbi:MAG: EAL domain-containing protein, partial [Thermoanaerobaculia bacterium]
TEFVLTLACRQCRTWHEEGLPIGIAVNVSARNVQDPLFPERIAHLLAACGLEARWLTLEITESSIVSDAVHAARVLKELRVMGLSLSIDDFGTGYSSLTHLKQLPVNEIKVDRSFIRDMVRSDSDAAIVHSTIDMSHNFGYEVVAEGVEDEATCEFLARLGCDMAQGYFLGVPMMPAEVGRWIEASRWELKRRGGARERTER